MYLRQRPPPIGKGLHTSIQIALDTAWLSGSGLPRERGRALLRLLGELGRSASLREAAAAAALSYRSAWGLLGDAARLFGAPLVEMQRGRPARLSSLGERILQADARVRAELGALLSDAGRRPGARLRLQGSHDLALEALRAACPPQLDLELLF